MRIVVTCYNGFIEQLIYPKLIELGVDVVLVGNNRDKLIKDFSCANCYDYSQLSEALNGAEIILHLAAVKSNTTLSRKEINAVNVDLLLNVANVARRAKIKRFINVTSIHTFENNNHSNYTNSRRSGVNLLIDMNWPAVDNIYLPIVYGDVWAGNLSLLNRLPFGLAKMLFYPISALKPTLNKQILVDYVLSNSTSKSRQSKLILHDDKSQNFFYVLFKWAMDFSFVLFIAVFFWWLMLLVWIGVRLTSKGPGIFVQTRVGKDQKLFKCYKFRTMQVGTKNVGTHEVAISSITPIGAFLRKTKIDELPQIVNILRNELSLIGPRPCLPNQLELIAEREALGVFEVKPGITGLGQINNVDMSTPKKLANWDARYIALRGIISDVKIIIATAIGSGQGDKTKV